MSNLPQVIYGFHGCDQSVGEAILSGAERELRKSENDYDWLGHGIYFWEDSPERAYQWAVECMKNPRLCRGRIKKPFVLGAVINAGHCLNLMTNEGVANLRAAHDSLQQTFSIAEANAGNAHNLDRAVINAAIILNQAAGLDPFDTVRGAFIEGNPIYPGAKLYDKTHIQICVVRPECICGYFLPSGFQQ